MREIWSAVTRVALRAIRGTAFAHRPAAVLMLEKRRRAEYRLPHALKSLAKLSEQTLVPPGGPIIGWRASVPEPPSAPCAESTRRAASPSQANVAQPWVRSEGMVARKVTSNYSASLSVSIGIAIGIARVVGRKSRVNHSYCGHPVVAMMCVKALISCSPIGSDFDSDPDPDLASAPHRGSKESASRTFGPSRISA